MWHYFGGCASSTRVEGSFASGRGASLAGVSLESDSYTTHNIERRRQFIHTTPHPGACYFFCIVCFTLFMSAYVQNAHPMHKGLAEYGLWITLSSALLVVYEIVLRFMATSPCMQPGGSLHGFCWRGAASSAGVRFWRYRTDATGDGSNASTRVEVLTFT